VRFVGYVFDDVQNTWSKNLDGYQKARMVLFRRGVRTACGTGTTAVGPFYCPNDQKVYIDLSFYDELRSRFGAPGDFAQAYVIAHEVRRLSPRRTPRRRR
jgi:predicted metalloprotease